MRISDWSSDVCSSDLVQNVGDGLALERHLQRLAVVALAVAHVAGDVDIRQEVHLDLQHAVALTGLAPPALDVEGEAPRLVRSEERRVGTECVRPCKSRLSPYQ